MWIRVAVPVVCSLVVAGTLWLALADRRRRIVVDDTGIKQWSLNGYREIAWSDVTRYRYVSLPQSIYDNDGGSRFVGMIAGAFDEIEARKRRRLNGYFGLGYLDIFTADSSKPLRFSKRDWTGVGTGYSDLSDLIGTILDELHERMPAPDHTPLHLLDATLRHDNGGAISVSDIARIHVVNGDLLLASRTGRHWPPIPMGSFDNCLLLLERLVQRGVLVTFSPEVYLPPSFTRS